ncbi:MAG TPA: sugar ABC transporter permease [Candidatus Alectryocaccomicrobium excrementavium]|uniref:Sugar ABC transporter permease n=1 Tax=Candidatus Alectryocaccomicrobium excrementavium TaxID=2840668 RepID=A0A9D1FZU5_9FIRM|nr:sugar ABC transporter permease [Candidatus Alectryocaccomicrobium excrementavium]
MHLVSTGAPSPKWQKFRRQIPLHIMLLPCVVIVLIYAYYPMIGLIIAFQNYNPRMGFFGSKWVGLNNFLYLMKMPNFASVMYNTVFIALMKMVMGLVVPIVYAILLDQIRNGGIKRTIQTIIYIPYFLSWVILSGILIDLLSPSTGLLADVFRMCGAEPIFFLAEPDLFPYLLVVTDVWKGAGYGTIIYLAAITSIDPSYYEAAVMDGANRFQQAIHITLPGMAPIVVLMATLSLGNILNAGFEQVLNLYSPVVYSTGDIIDTFVYRIGLQNNQFGVATAAGLFKSAVSFVFIAAGYLLAYKFADYTVF